MKTRTDIEFEGWRAYYSDEGRDTCPYDDWRREAWLEGWANAWAADD